jgi:acyl carrier protein
VTAEAGFKQALRDWLISQSSATRLTDFDDDTPLIERRILTSLQVMDLVLFLEELTGRPVDVEQLKPGVFRSVNAIYATFGAPPGGA